MSRFTRPVAAAALAAAASVSGASAQTTVEAEGCRVVRILADGRRVETPPKPGAARPDGSRSVTVSASSRGGSSSRASVSASSSSGGGGRSTASSTAASVDGQGRTVTITHNEEGCTVVIDERTAPGG